MDAQSRTSSRIKALTVCTMWNNSGAILVPKILLAEALEPVSQLYFPLCPFLFQSPPFKAESASKRTEPISEGDSREGIGN